MHVGRIALLDKSQKRAFTAEDASPRCTPPLTDNHVRVSFAKSRLPATAQLLGVLQSGVGDCFSDKEVIADQIYEKLWVRQIKRWNKGGDDIIIVLAEA
jgi:hypothetical protein